MKIPPPRSAPQCGRAGKIKAPIVIDIRSASRRYYFSALPVSTPENEDWARRKGNAELHCHASSMLVRLRLEQEGRSQWPDAALPWRDYVAHAGGFPIRVKRVGLVAAIGVSGLPSREDHDLSVQALSEHLGVADFPATP